MADLTLTDRLQPALLDRLLDDERTIALVRVIAEVVALERLQLPAPALIEILQAQGLNLQEQQLSATHLELRFTAERARVNPAQLRALTLRPPGAPQGVALQSFASVDSSSILNSEIEPPERRMLSRTRLRECVHRDLRWLFNSLNLASSQDLAPFPEVAASVLNFGLPSFAGRMTSSIDALDAAERLRRAIELFEPRLRLVRVMPRSSKENEADRDGTLEFTIEAELWGQPASQHLQLHTRIDTVSGEIALQEARGA
jgi:type VI secretion system lysozyme-like protein